MIETLFFCCDRLRASLKGIRYIFCINTGRAGSEYLASLLGTASGVYSFHEPAPQMIGDYLHMVAGQGIKATFAERRIKSKAIIEMVSRLPSRSVYVETSNMFIKTFYDVILHDLQNVTVIYLKRDLLQTLKSFVQLCYFSKKNSAWPDWMISPNAKTAAIKCIGLDNELDYIDLSIAYLIDIEARARSFQFQYPKVPFFEVDITALNDPAKVKNLFTYLGISYSEKTEEMIGRRINQRPGRKEKYANPVEEQELEERFRAYLCKGKDMGIVFPERIFKYI